MDQLARADAGQDIRVSIVAKVHREMERTAPTLPRDRKQTKRGFVWKRSDAPFDLSLRLPGSPSR
jgi:hypothetical protein